MGSFWQDLRYALRTLRRSAVFTTVAVVTLALGIGANSAIFSVVNEVLLRPAPLVKEPRRLVALGWSQDGKSFGGFSHPDYLIFRDQSHVFSGLMAYRGTPLNLSGGSEPVRINGMLVSSNYFSVLGINPLHGRFFFPEEDQTPDSHPVAIISDSLWKRRFGADGGLVGKTLTLNGQLFTVVGIAPEGFKGTELGDSIDAWIPLMMEARARPLFPTLNSRLFSPLSVVGRLKPNVNLAQVHAELSLLAGRLAAADAQTFKNKQILLSSEIRFLNPEWRADARNLLAVLMIVVGLVLLIACANVTNLLLARASARRKEIAVRLAIGSTRVRLIRQLLTESLSISLLGGSIGIMLALWARNSLRVLVGPEFDLTPDLRVVGFSFLLSLLTGMIFGLAPALQASKPDLIPALKGAANDGGYRRARLRELLVIFEVALSLVLTIAGGLCIRTLRNIQTIDLGFETRHVLAAPVDLRSQGYTEAGARHFLQQLADRVTSLPGVQAASFGNEMPLSGFLSGTKEVLIEGQIPAGNSRGIPVDHHEIGTEYFKTLGVELVRGRDFSEHDQLQSPGVVIINETMARRFWPGADPIGKRLRLVRFMAPPGRYLQVIGVAKDSRYHRLEAGARSHIYLPLTQNFEFDTVLFVRSESDTNVTRAAVKQVIQQLDRDLPVYDFKTLADWITELNSDQRMTATLTGLVGLLALTLAAVGLYGVMSNIVAQRSYEIGVRLAMGAQAREVLCLVVGRALLLPLLGVAVGLCATLRLTRFIAGRLYGVSTTDPVIFAGAAVLLLAVALAASYIPARRATKVEPMIVLRHE